MSKYTLIHENDDGTKISVEGTQEGAYEMMEDFKAFLLAISFHPHTVEKIQYIDEN